MAPRFAVLLAGASLLAMAACTESDTTTEAGTSTAEPESSTQGGDSLLARLRDGGLTIVIRHAETDQSKPDDATVDLNDCATQRNLSEKGRSDARSINTAIDRLDIPVGAVWASPYCRSKETAELAFDRFEVVHGLEQLYPDRDEQADQRLNGLIREQAPREGEPNLIIASHGVYPGVLSPPATIGEGEAALYARAGNGFELVDRLEPGEWAELSSGADEPSGGPDELNGGADELSGGVARVLGRRNDVDIAALRIDDGTTTRSSPRRPPGWVASARRVCGGAGARCDGGGAAAQEGLTTLMGVHPGADQGVNRHSSG